MPDLQTLEKVVSSKNLCTWPSLEELEDIDLAPVVQTLDSTVQRINVRETNCAIRWIVIYPSSG